jgi:hypothetical protein
MKTKTKEPKKWIEELATPERRQVATDLLREADHKIGAAGRALRDNQRVTRKELREIGHALRLAALGLEELGEHG